MDVDVSHSIPVVLHITLLFFTHTHISVLGYKSVHKVLVGCDLVLDSYIPLSDPFQYLLMKLLLDCGSYSILVSHMIANSVNCPLTLSQEFYWVIIFFPMEFWMLSQLCHIMVHIWLDYLVQNHPIVNCQFTFLIVRTFVCVHGVDGQFSFMFLQLLFMCSIIFVKFYLKHVHLCLKRIKSVLFSAVIFFKPLQLFFFLIIIIINSPVFCHALHVLDHAHLVSCPTLLLWR